MQFKVLEADAYATEYRTACRDLHLPTEEDKALFRDGIFAVQGAIEEALKSKWDSDDFEVGWDFNYCYFTCGGIYSERIFCRQYVETIHEALQSIDPQGVWTYHTVCEISGDSGDVDHHPQVDCRGEFFVRGDICYVDGDRMELRWQAKLGCND